MINVKKLKTETSASSNVEDLQAQLIRLQAENQYLLTQLLPKNQNPKGETNEYENVFLCLPRDMVKDIIFWLHTISQQAKKSLRLKGTGLKAFFICSKSIRLTFWKTFVEYLSFNWTVLQFQYPTNPFPHIHFESPYANLDNSEITSSISIYDRADLYITSSQNIERIDIYCHELDRDISFHLFSKLQVLNMGPCTQRLYIDELPSSLTELTCCGEITFSHRSGKWPPKLRKLNSLNVYTFFTTLPSSLEELVTTYSSFDSGCLKSLPNIKRLELHSTWGGVINLPSTLEELIIANGNQVYFEQLPQSLKTLEISTDSLEKPLPPLPQLRRLILSCYFNDPVDSLPSSLVTLEIHTLFNRPVDSLPEGLKHLQLSDCFSHPIDKLPKQLETLLLGSDFNQPIDSLPPGLIYLKLDGTFNQPIDHLPAGLQKLWIFGDFNQPIEHLPASLLELSIQSEFQQPLNNLPPHLTRLSLSFCSTHQSQYGHNLNQLPRSLTRLFVEGDFNSEITLPESLTSLTIASRIFNQPIQSLPEGLLELRLDAPRFSQPLLGILPQSLLQLRLNINNRDEQIYFDQLFPDNDAIPTVNYQDF